MSAKNIIIVIIALVTSINTGGSQTKIEKLDELISKYSEYGKFNGTILVAEKGEVIYKKGFGLANMELNVHNQVDTKFRLASVTKQFTSLLIMQLVADGKLALHTPITSYLPSYPKKNGDRITIHQLLTHTSGIPNYTSLPNYRKLMSVSIQPTEIIDLFAHLPLEFEPGEKHVYSNSGYALLGVIIEQITGKSFDEVLHDKILSPLQMTNSGFNDQERVIENRASGYYRFGGSFNNANFIDLSIAYTAGGMYSTVEDLFLWDQALYTNKLLPPKYLNQMFEKHVAFYGRHYGYGWEIGEMAKGQTGERVPVVNHGGSINGFNTLITRIPADNSSIILLNNTSGAPLYQMSRAISGILYDKPYNLPKKSVAYSLLEVIKDEGYTKGLSFYKKIKNFSSYDLSEHEMNMVGYDLLQSKDASAAEVVFKLNIEAFPNSSNAYDSYAEALLALGNKEEAIINYKKSVQLNPDNKNGIKALKELGVIVPTKEELYFLETDSLWSKEIFNFPLGFAPKIKFSGTEDARFTPGWANRESNEFWSYAFAWNIDSDHHLNEDELQKNVQLYFDGLMNAVNKDKDLTVPKTEVVLHTEEQKSSHIHHIGHVRLHDSFHTKKMIELNVTVEQSRCNEKGKVIALFRFSPKEYGNEVWQALNRIKVKPDTCDK